MPAASPATRGPEEPHSSAEQGSSRRVTRGQPSPPGAPPRPETSLEVGLATPEGEIPTLCHQSRHCGSVLAAAKHRRALRGAGWRSALAEVTFLQLANKPALSPPLLQLGNRADFLPTVELSNPRLVLCQRLHLPGCALAAGWQHRAVAGGLGALLGVTPCPRDTAPGAAQSPGHLPVPTDANEQPEQRQEQGPRSSSRSGFHLTVVSRGAFGKCLPYGVRSPSRQRSGRVGIETAAAPPASLRLRGEEGRLRARERLPGCEEPGMLLAHVWGWGLTWPPAPLDTAGMGSGTPWCHGNTQGLRQQLQEERQISSSCEYKGTGLHPHPHMCWVRDGMLGVTPARWPEPPLGAPGTVWGWPRKRRGAACILRGLISSSKAATATRSEGGQLHGAAQLGSCSTAGAAPGSACMAGGRLPPRCRS